MDFKLVDHYEALSEECAQILLRFVRENPQARICLATGHSPRLAYRKFVAGVKTRGLDLREVVFIKLDEWAGPEMDDPATSEYFLRTEVIDPLGIDARHYLSFESAAEDLSVECARVAAEMAALGPLDLVILGVGPNGHLALNEPAAELQMGIHVAELSESTRSHPTVQSARRAIRQGMTLGVGDILAAREAVLLVAGAGKQEAYRALRKGTLSTACPASMLHLHARAVCIAEAEAAGVS